jgi:4-hydroxybenzoate polyprenyltransferase
VAFGSLPAVVSLAAPRPELPAAWIVAAGTAFGTAAHFINTLSELADDAATGIKGLPQRIGGRRSQVVATVLLLAASMVTVLGPGGSPPGVAWSGCSSWGRWPSAPSPAGAACRSAVPSPSRS